jgi:hypothetical protein
VHKAIWKKSPGKLSKIIILLHAITQPGMADLTKVTLATVGWEIMNYPPHSPNMAPSDFNLFAPMKVHLGGQKFQTDDELKHGVLNWLCNMSDQ